MGLMPITVSTLALTAEMSQTMDSDPVTEVYCTQKYWSLGLKVQGLTLDDRVSFTGATVSMSFWGSSFAYPQPNSKTPKHRDMIGGKTAQIIPPPPSHQDVCLTIFWSFPFVVIIENSLFQAHLLMSPFCFNPFPPFLRAKTAKK